MQIEDLPGNSRTKQPVEKKVTRVVSGNVTSRKRPLLARLFGETSRDVGSYIIWDILIPAAKSTINDIISNGVEMLLYGEPQRRGHRRERSYVNYNTISSGRKTYRNQFDKPGYDEKPVYRRNDFSNPSDVVIESREDAKEVLDQLLELIETYEVATVADFYDLLGIPSEWTHNKYGWDDLSRAAIVRVREGYCIDLPKAIPLD